MPKLYLLGGENVNKRNAWKVNERAFRNAGNAPTVLVFPWARASFDNAFLKRKILSEYFISLGAGRIEFVDYSETKELIKEKMAESNLVYFTGGLVSALVERIQKADIANILRNYSGVIVGRSAGTLALCKRGIVTGRKSKKMRIFNGLALTDLTVKVHYRPLHEKLLNSLSLQQDIYAIPSRSAIIVEKEKLTYIGKVYLFSKGRKRRIN